MKYNQKDIERTATTKFNRQQWRSTEPQPMTVQVHRARPMAAQVHKHQPMIHTTSENESDGTPNYSQRKREYTQHQPMTAQVHRGQPMAAQVHRMPVNQSTNTKKDSQKKKVHGTTAHDGAGPKNFSAGTQNISIKFM